MSFIKPENVKKLMQKLASERQTNDGRFLAKTQWSNKCYSVGTDGHCAVIYQGDFGFDGHPRLAESIVNTVRHATPGDGFVQLSMPTTTTLRKYFQSAIEDDKTEVFFAGKVVNPGLVLKVLKYTKRGYPVSVASDRREVSPIILSVNSVWHAIISPMKMPRYEATRETCQRDLFWKYEMLDPFFDESALSDVDKALLESYK